VLSHAYWSSRFGADPGMLNRTMVVNGRGRTIVGVAQKGFSSEQPGLTPELFVPITMKKEMTPDWDGIKDRKDYWVTLFGRLKPGTTLEQATTAINITYQPQLQQDIALLSTPKPETLQRYRAKKIELKPGLYGRGQLREQGRKPLLLLLAMTFLVLLIACANVANLQLTRALARSRETAVRLALGASRWQLAGELLLESSVVALAGAALGANSSIRTSRLATMMSGPIVRGGSAARMPRSVQYATTRLYQHRTGGRPGRRCRGGSADPVGALRDEARRSVDLRVGRRGAGRHRAGGRVRARAPGHRRRSDDRAAVRVGRATNHRRRQIGN
jgi:hypothetical protein